MHYRKEIDGLRAVAVVPVLFFHAGFENFAGGFVGVDVFFVISGFLITSIILEEQLKAKFTILSFYERRARRILPALFLVMSFCVPFAWIFMEFPNDLQNFGQSLIATSLFSSNILFWQESGYFEGAAELKPLLHTWSLAVEEQYYLIFPLFMILMFRVARFWTLVVLTAAAIGSLCLAQWGSINAQSANFYLLPTRGWELLIGVFAAYYLNDKAPDHKIFNGNWGDVLSVLGLVMVIASVFVYNEYTPFPGVWALLPTVGTVLIILFAVEGTLVCSLLGLKPIVGIGLISYSLYLWHQPLFAFARMNSAEEVKTSTYLVLIAVAVLLAYLSWRYVENIFRNRKGMFDRSKIFTLSAIGIIFFVGLGSVINAKQGFLNRLSASQLEIYKYVDYLNEVPQDARKCFLEGGGSFDNFAPSCQAADGKNQVLLWGDSHAAALTSGMERLLTNLSQYTASACPPLYKVSIPRRPYCAAINDFVIGKIGSIKPAQVIIHANWLLYSDQLSQLALLNALEDTFAAIEAVSPASKILIVGSMPRWEPSLPATMIRAELKLDSEHYVPSSKFMELAELDRLIADISTSHQAEFFSVLKRQCREEKCLATLMMDGKYQLFAWDNSHMTIPGSIMLAKQINDQILLSDRKQ